MTRAALVAAIVLASTACGGTKKATPDSLATCIHDHGGVATASGESALAKGVPGRRSGTVEFSIPVGTQGRLSVGAVLLEQTDRDADRAAQALHHLDPSAIHIPGVDLSMLPTFDAFKTGQAERHGRLIVLWLDERKARSAKTTRAVEACV